MADTEPSLELALRMLRQLRDDINVTKESLREVLRRVSHLEHLYAHSAGVDADREARVDRFA
jgi:hypothetical protein